MRLAHKIWLAASKSWRYHLTVIFLIFSTKERKWWIAWSSSRCAGPESLLGATKTGWRKSGGRDRVCQLLTGWNWEERLPNTIEELATGTLYVPGFDCHLVRGSGVQNRFWSPCIGSSVRLGRLHLLGPRLRLYTRVRRFPGPNRRRLIFALPELMNFGTAERTYWSSMAGLITKPIAWSKILWKAAPELRGRSQNSILVSSMEFRWHIPSQRGSSYTVDKIWLFKWPHSVWKTL